MKVLKFNGRKVFFASDFHLSHKQPFIWQARGFTSIKEHADSIIDGINATVGEDDVLFYLGDFSLNSNLVETTDYFRRIKCQNIYYIWGNHESAPRLIYNTAVATALNGAKNVSMFGTDVYPFHWENVTFLGHYAIISVNNQLIVLDHFAHAIWDMMQHGAWNICGHSHGNCPPLNKDAVDGKIFDCGVDNALKIAKVPCFSFEQIAEIMERKNIVVIDHHNRETT